MEDKLAKLKKASAEADKAMNKAREAFEDSERRLNAAKELLKNMDEEDQKKIQVNDTKLPELLELHTLAKEEYVTAQKRHETNLKYVKIFEDKVKS